jgi:hypothetical protein
MNSKPRVSTWHGVKLSHRANQESGQPRAKSANLENGKGENKPNVYM